LERGNAPSDGRYLYGLGVQAWLNGDDSSSLFQRLSDINVLVVLEMRSNPDLHQPTIVCLEKILDGGLFCCKFRLALVHTAGAPMDLPVHLLMFRAYIEKYSRFIEGIGLDSPTVEGVGARTHLEVFFARPAIRNSVLADFACMVVQV
jgi:hypothetical protein